MMLRGTGLGQLRSAVLSNRGVHQLSKRAFGADFTYSYIDAKEEKLLRDFEAKLNKPLTPKEARLQYFALRNSIIPPKELIPSTPISFYDYAQQLEKAKDRTENRINADPRGSLLRALRKVSDLEEPIVRFEKDQSHRPVGIKPTTKAAVDTSKRKFAITHPYLAAYYRFVHEVKIPIHEELSPYYYGMKEAPEDLFVKEGLLTSEQLDEVKQVLETYPLSFMQQVVNMRLLDEEPKEKTVLPTVQDLEKELSEDEEKFDAKLRLQMEAHQKTIEEEADRLGVDMSVDFALRRKRWERLFTGEKRSVSDEVKFANIWQASPDPDMPEVQRPVPFVPDPYARAHH